MKPFFLPAVIAMWSLAALGDPSVAVLRLPGGAVQADLAVDRKGGIHAVYLSGEPGKADVLYATISNDHSKWQNARPVSDKSSSAIAIGAVRGANLAIGPDGTVHVAWMGSEKQPSDKTGLSPMFYSRLLPGSKAFEPARNLMTQRTILDGGGAITADAKGNVRVFWNGGPEGNQSGEQGRRVYSALSTDSGVRFASETIVAGSERGVCACCWMHAGLDETDVPLLVFRAADELTKRPEVLLRLTEQPVKLTETLWQTGGCPMSTASVTRGAGFSAAAWETDGQITVAKVKNGASELLPPMKGSVKRRNPSVAINAAGEMLVAWTEGTGWARGGSTHWQVIDPSGQALSTEQRRGDLPVWGLVTTIASDKRFLVVY